MALEVNEIGIRVRVRDAERDPSAEDEKAEDRGSGCGSVDREQIVDDCVRRVLRILQARQGR